MGCLYNFLKDTVVCVCGGGFKIQIVYYNGECCAAVFDHLKRWRASAGTRSTLSWTYLYTQQSSGQPPPSGSPGQMVDLMGLLIQRKPLDSKLYDNWKKGEQIWFKSIRHNMEMALISFSLSRKRLGILQRLESY